MQLKTKIKIYSELHYDFTHATCLPSGKIIQIKFDSKMEVPKMRTKTCYVWFFEDSNIKLNKAMLSNWLCLNIEAVALKKKQVLEKIGFPVYS